MTNRLPTLAQADESADEDILSIPRESVVNAIEPYAQSQVLDDIFTPPPFLLARDVRPQAPSASPLQPATQASSAEPASHPTAAVSTAEPLAEPRAFNPPVEAPAAYAESAPQPESVEARADAAERQEPAADAAHAINARVTSMPAAESSAPAPEAPAAEPEAPSVERPMPAPKLDNYAVGMRILRISPAWLLLSSVGFFLVIFLLSWLYQPATQIAGTAPPLSNHTANEATTARDSAPSAARSSAPETIATQDSSAAQSPAEAASVQTSTETAQSFAPATTAPQASQPDGNFAVQVGSYTNLSDANGRVSELRAAGFDVRAAAAEIPQRGTWYRVYVGSFQTREEAARFGNKLRSEGVASASLVVEVK
jgi:hypothetical protein